MDGYVFQFWGEGIQQFLEFYSVVSCLVIIGWVGRFGRWRERFQSCVCFGGGLSLVLINRQFFFQFGYNWFGLGILYYVVFWFFIVVQFSLFLFFFVWIEDFKIYMLGDFEVRFGFLGIVNGSIQFFVNGFCEYLGCLQVGSRGQIEILVSIFFI